MLRKTLRMTSTARTYKRSRGFTLLEIIIVLSIAAIVMAGAVGMMIYSSDERTLRDYSGKIELLAKRAHTTAILKQTSYAIEFRQGIVRMLPLARALEDTKTVRGRRIGGELVAQEGDEERQINLKEGINTSIRRWNSEAWISTAKDNIFIWRFDPDGLCEPITVHLSLGDSWSEDTYSPLTAAISEHQFETR